MESKTLKTLEFDKILSMLTDFAKNDKTKAKILKLKPSSDFRVVEQTQDETDSAVTMILKYGSPELVRMNDVGESIKRLSVGGGLSMGELLNIAKILKGARLMKKYTPEQTGVLCGYIEELVPSKKLEDRITSSIISEEEISDNASPELSSIRRKMKNTSAKIKDTLDTMIHSQSYKKILQDQLVTVRNNRYVVPVKAEHRGEVKGITHDMSSSGSTLFVEPEGVVNANNELHELSVREKNEIERILLEISGEVAEIIEDVRLDFDTLIHLDFVFAKARLSLDMKATAPVLNRDGVIRIKSGRHPLIDKRAVVPIDVELGSDFDTLIVTGPNTGGKTVVLKTIGLFALMTQAGLQLPASDGTTMPVCPDIFADIGDEQSIEQSLSTFSSHMKNIVAIFTKSTADCLILFDELGAGTDPTEGAALATAIIESFRSKGARIAATTHYSELKTYALTTQGVENASCEFDVNTLSPTYRLLVGIPGKSNAFAISEKLGLPQFIIERSREILSEESLKFEDVLAKIETNRISAEQSLAAAEKLKAETERLRAELEAERQKIENQKDKIYDKARAKAEKIITSTQTEVEQMLAEIKLAQKEKNDQEAIRQLQELRRSLGLRHRNNTSPKAKKQPKPVGKAVNLNTLKLGASVMLNDLGDVGSVISINKKDNTAVVQVGIMKVTSSAENLSLASDKETKYTTPTPSISRKASNIRRDAVQNEIDLRGMTLEVAELEVDKFLDECSLYGLSSVSIIHGKGTGTLRSGIQAMLRHHPHVKNFRLGKYGEGEDGVTIVTLK